MAFAYFCAAVKSSYATMTSIHIYSLSPHRLQDLQTLSDTSRQLYNTYFVKEDPLEHNATYGVILNKNVKRRTGRRPPPPPIDSRPIIKAEKTAKTTSKAVENPFASHQPSVKKEETSRPSSAGSTTATSTKKPTLKRDTSDIFKSFAKAKKAPTKTPPSLSRNSTDSSLGNTSAEEKGTDIKFGAASEDEGDSEEDALFLNRQTRGPARAPKKRPSTGKADREAKLRKMMDDSDEEKEDAQLMDPEQAGLGTGDKPKGDGQSQDAALKQGTGTPHDDHNRESEGEESVNWSDSDTGKPQPSSSKKKADDDQ